MNKTLLLRGVLACALVLTLTACGDDTETAASTEAAVAAVTGTDVSAPDGDVPDEGTPAEGTQAAGTTSEVGTPDSEPETEESTSGATEGRKLSRQQQLAEDFLLLIRDESNDGTQAAEMVSFAKDAYIDREKLVQLLTASKVVNEIRDLYDTYEITGSSDHGAFVYRDTVVALNIDLEGSYNLFRDGTGISEQNRASTSERTYIELYRDPETGEYLLGNLTTNDSYDWSK